MYIDDSCLYNEYVCVFMLLPMFASNQTNVKDLHTHTHTQTETKKKRNPRKGV